MNLQNIIKFIKKRKLLVGVVVGIIAIVLIYVFFIRKPAEAQTLTVQKGEFLQQVSVSGKVTAAQNVDLSFEQGGIIRSVPVKVGDQVSAGKLLAAQDTSQLYTQLAEMQAGIDLQKAKLAQSLAGSSPENITIAEDGVVLAEQNLTNSYQSALITANAAFNVIYNASTVVSNVQNSYFYANDQQGLKVNDARNAINAILQSAKSSVDAANASMAPSDVDLALSKLSLALGSTSVQLSIIRNQCDESVYFSRVSADDKAALDTQKTNTNTSLSSVATSQQSISSYRIALKQAQNQLDLAKAGPRETDVAVLDAQIKQAQAAAQNVAVQIRKRQIFAPISGVITTVNAKAGSTASVGEVAIAMISAGEFQVESYVPEIYISLVRVGNEAEITLDAFGPDKKFMAKVVSIDPSQTQKDGVSTYKTTLQFVEKADVKDGMSANVVIITNKKENVISVPQGLVMSKSGKKVVLVRQGENVVEKEVVVGDVSSSGRAEIVSGLNEGDVLIVK